MPTPVTTLRPAVPARRELTAEEQSYVDLPALTPDQQASYLLALRGMTEEQLNAERRRVQERWFLFQYASDRRPNHPDRWRSEQVNAELQRRVERANMVGDTVSGTILGTVAGATAGAIMGNYKKGAAIGAFAGAVAPHVSTRAQALARLGRLVWGFLGSRGSMRY